MTWTFTATHGVQFRDEHGDIWAEFEMDRALHWREGRGDMYGYRFTTDDPKIAKRLRAVRQYGITEVKQPQSDAADAHQQ